MTLIDIDSIQATHRIPTSKLQAKFDPRQFPFETTDDLDILPTEMIGQQRAVKAMEFGLSVEQSDYNLFVVGPSGTGRMTYTLNSVVKMAENRDAPEDWCYVYNFENPNRPLVISLPAGQGRQFQRFMETLLIAIERELRAAFSSELFEKKKQTILNTFREKVDQYWKQTEQFATENHYLLERTSNGINTYPIFDGKPMERSEFDQLPEDQKETYRKNEKLVGERIRETFYQMRKMDEQLTKSIDLFMKQTATEAIERLFQPFKEVYKDNPKVISYIEAYFHDVVMHFSLFLADHEEESNIMNALAGSKEQQLHRYTVNLFVDHKNLNGAPVIYETNPTFHNLFGKVEYHGSLGSWMTDFTYIKPGALHMANGGYLVLQAAELLQEPLVWTQLKRSLQIGRVQIENLYEERGVFPSSGLKPEPIPLNIKVIIIGSYYLYDLLSAYDEDFHKLFKVKVEYDTSMERDMDNSMKMAYFIKKYATEEGLLPFHQRAVAKVIEYSSRLVEDQSKLSTRFQEITKLLVESSYWAKKEGAAVVDGNHIANAISEKIQRSNLVMERYREMIAKGVIMVETDGYRIGQINGLAVIGTRDASFGIPTKITAQTYVGKSGIINIEREASMSGHIHNKGLMILTGFLSGQFAKNHPIPLSASITFEQTYSPIDGDSASSTELYVLLSSLAEVPIYQGIAVTGSVNQWGEIQPIGGVNEKIEGFFQICKLQGLTGKQGVIIPKQNVMNLTLDDEVITAVESGQFHIWEIDHISEGIEILTGVQAGNVRDVQGQFPGDTIFGKVEKRFAEMFERLKEINK
ncbi:Lon protease family protein [Bacillus sp. JJ1764]|uniref:Lon protease family protein n=1 Tax=Bacillus sp. JJ1764 TaxID=3122964 RepID=UPI002FFE4E0B